jgi:hypothetical protein
VPPAEAKTPEVCERARARESEREKEREGEERLCIRNADTGWMEKASDMQREAERQRDRQRQRQRLCIRNDSHYADTASDGVGERHEAGGCGRQRCSQGLSNIQQQRSSNTAAVHQQRSGTHAFERPLIAPESLNSALIEP